MHRAPRNFRPRVDNLAQYNDDELVERYRLNRQGILYIVRLVEDDLSPATDRNHSLSAEEKVLIALRYLASGHFQLDEGDLNGVSQPTVSKLTHDFLRSLTRPEIIQNHIKFPTEEREVRAQQQAFHAVAGFPNVVGLVDGTHVQIKAPTRNEPDYVNRQRYHSINTQIICDSNDRIINVVAKWPGSTHDSRILNTSAVRTIFEGGRMPAGHCYLLGDSGYACRHWCLTPYANPTTNSQRAYNVAHKTTRSKVERVIGQLKRRWSVLHGEIRIKTEMVPRLIVACVILHNICKDRNIPLPPDNNNNNNNNIPPHNVYNGPQGLAFRDHIATTYF